MAEKWVPLPSMQRWLGGKTTERQILYNCQTAMRSQRKKTPRKRKAELLGPVKGTISTDPTPPIPSRLQKFLALADETLEREVLQRSVIDVQPVFQPPKPPRLKQPKPPVRAPLPPPPPLKLPKPPKPPKTPKPLSSMPKRKQS